MTNFHRFHNQITGKCFHRKKKFIEIIQYKLHYGTALQTKKKREKNYDYLT